MSQSSKISMSQKSITSNSKSQKSISQKSNSQINISQKISSKKTSNNQPIVHTVDNVSNNYDNERKDNSISNNKSSKSNNISSKSNNISSKSNNNSNKSNNKTKNLPEEFYDKIADLQFYSVQDIRPKNRIFPLDPNQLELIYTNKNNDTKLHMVEERIKNLEIKNRNLEIINKMFFDKLKYHYDQNSNRKKFFDKNIEQLKHEIETGDTNFNKHFSFLKYMKENKNAVFDINGNSNEVYRDLDKEMNDYRNELNKIISDDKINNIKSLNIIKKSIDELKNDFNNRFEKLESLNQQNRELISQIIEIEKLKQSSPNSKISSKKDSEKNSINRSIKTKDNNSINRSQKNSSNKNEDNNNINENKNNNNKSKISSFYTNNDKKENTEANQENKESEPKPQTDNVLVKDNNLPGSNPPPKEEEQQPAEEKKEEPVPAPEGEAQNTQS